MSVLSILVATLGGETFLPLALEPFYWPRVGGASLVTLPTWFVFIQRLHHPSLILELGFTRFDTQGLGLDQVLYGSRDQGAATTWDVRNS